MSTSCGADVIVVGGGPAGSAAAIWAASAGLRVRLYERSVFPRHRPGETLHPGTGAIFRQLGVESQVDASCMARHIGQRVVWRGREREFEFGSDEQGAWRGYQILRARLDSILIARAREVGVEVVQAHAVQRAMTLGRRVIGVEATESIRASFVIDAGGGRSWLARQMGLRVEHASPALRAYYGYCQVGSEEEEALPSLTANAGGWTWIASIGGRQVHWTRMSFEKGEDARSPPPHLAALPRTDKVRGADVTWRLVPAAAGRGYFMVGDAAAVLDPAASHGVLRALMSGIMASHVARGVLDGAVDEDIGAALYRDWISTWYRHDLSQLVVFYRQLPKPPSWLAALP